MNLIVVDAAYLRRGGGGADLSLRRLVNMVEAGEFCGFVFAVSALTLAGCLRRRLR